MSRLYIRVMTGFYTHRKTVRLLSKIGTEAYSLPPRVWAYCAENQPDGDLSSYQSEELSVLVAYKGDASSMLVALKDCGFIDLDGKIHDWKEHNGYHEKYSERAKTAAEARWAKERKEPKERSTEKRKVESGDKHCLEHATSMSIPTIDEVKLIAAKTGLPESEAEKFFHFYESKGWRVGKSPMKKWHSALAGWKTRWQQQCQPEERQESEVESWS